MSIINNNLEGSYFVGKENSKIYRIEKITKYPLFFGLRLKCIANNEQINIDHMLFEAKYTILPEEEQQICKVLYSENKIF